MSRRSCLLVALVTAFGLLLPGCGGGRDAITIYSGRTENLVGPLLEQFSKETGIAIDVRYGDSADLALLIGEERDRTPADVFFSQSPGAVGFLAGKRLLAKLDQEVLDRVNARFRNRQGRWVGVSGRQRVLVYNTELVGESDLPRSIFDLTEPRYSGKVAIAPTNASFQDFVTALREVAGEERARAWLSGMAANNAPTYPNNNAIVAAVARGEVPMGLANHYYNFRFHEEDPSAPTANYVFPGGDIGALVIPSAASILEPSQDKERAARLVAFLLSNEAQEYFSRETFEYPLAAGVEPAGDLPELSGDASPAYDFDDLGGGLERTTQLIAQSGLER